MAARRKPVRKSTTPESTATRRLRKPPQLCKRSVASARKRSYRSSLFPASNLLHERFEARIAAKIVEEWISRKEEQVAFVAFRKAVLERFDGAFFFAQRGVSGGQGVIRNLCGLRHFIQVREKFSRLIRLSIAGIGLGEHGDGIRIVV